MLQEIACHQFYIQLCFLFFLIKFLTNWSICKNYESCTVNLSYRKNLATNQTQYQICQNNSKLQTLNCQHNLKHQRNHFCGAKLDNYEFTDHENVNTCTLFCSLKQESGRISDNLVNSSPKQYDFGILKDGSYCQIGSSVFNQGICIRGQCQPIADTCEETRNKVNNINYNYIKNDQKQPCLMCTDQGSSLFHHKTIFYDNLKMTLIKQESNNVVTIPAGSQRIEITQFSKESRLSVIEQKSNKIWSVVLDSPSSVNQNYFLSSKDKLMAAPVLNYERNPASGFEKITIFGVLDYDLHIDDGL